MTAPQQTCRTLYWYGWGGLAIWTLFWVAAVFCLLITPLFPPQRLYLVAVSNLSAKEKLDRRDVSHAMGRLTDSTNLVSGALAIVGQCVTEDIPAGTPIRTTMLGKPDALGNCGEPASAASPQQIALLEALLRLRGTDPQSTASAVAELTVLLDGLPRWLAENAGHQGSDKKPAGAFDAFLGTLASRAGERTADILFGSRSATPCSTTPCSAASGQAIRALPRLWHRIVHFPVNGPALTGEAASTLDALAAELSTQLRCGIVITAHADHTGSADFNFLLSWRRGKSVADRLTGRGIPGDWITIQPRSYEQPATYAPGAFRAANRRAEVMAQCPPA